MITVGTKVKITGDNLYGCVGTVLVVQKVSAVKNPEYLVRLNKDNPKSIRCGWSVDAFCQGNAMKYLFRWQFKNGAEDLKKARWYIDKLLEKWDGQVNNKGD